MLSFYVADIMIHDWKLFDYSLYLTYENVGHVFRIYLVVKKNEHK